MARRRRKKKVVRPQYRQEIARFCPCCRAQGSMKKRTGKDMVTWTWCDNCGTRFKKPLYLSDLIQERVAVNA